ncbi:MAG: O-antigen ligase family protein, partial [Candidatus Omnitrophica bacterium]|nr:O-antigen ligase family protein [Candidatus Omnitrophota bacterium]
FIGLIAISLISFFNSVNLKSSIQGIEKLLKYGILFVTVADSLRDKKHLRWIIMALIFGLTMASIDGFYSLAFGKDFLRHSPPDFDPRIGTYRLKAACSDANLFGGYIALFLPVLLAFALYYSGGRKRIVLLAFSTVSLAAVIFTFSRSAIFGVWLALFFMARLKKDRPIIFLLIVALLAAPFIFIMSGNIREWIRTETSSFWEILLNYDRPLIYRVALEMIKTHPFIGVGVNTFSLNFQKHKHIANIKLADASGLYAHNIYLHLPAEIGLIGLAVFIYILWRIFKTWYMFNRNTQDLFLKTAGMGIIAGIIAFLVNGLTETNLYTPKVATLFFFIIGLFFGVNKIAKEGNL